MFSLSRCSRPGHRDLCSPQAASPGRPADVCVRGWALLREGAQSSSESQRDSDPTECGVPGTTSEPGAGVSRTRPGPWLPCLHAHARSPTSVHHRPVGREGPREGQCGATGMPDSSTGWGPEPQLDLGLKALISGLFSSLQSGCGCPSPQALRGRDAGPGQSADKGFAGLRTPVPLPPQPGLGPVARGPSQLPTPRPSPLLTAQGQPGEGERIVI